jgi:hypothetical protein
VLSKDVMDKGYGYFNESFSGNEEIPEKLGGVLEKYFEKKDRSIRQGSRLVELWEEILPEELYRASSIESLRSGVLYVRVMPGAFMHEFKLIKQELIERLGDLAGVFDIKLKPWNGKK